MIEEHVRKFKTIPGTFKNIQTNLGIEKIQDKSRKVQDYSGPTDVFQVAVRAIKPTNAPSILIVPGRGTPESLGPNPSECPGIRPEVVDFTIQ